MSVMFQLETTSSILDFVKRQLEGIGTPFEGVEVFKGTSEEDLFSGFIQGIGQPSAVVIYRGGRYQSNPVRKMDFSVVVTTRLGETLPAAWELMDWVVLTVDGLRVEETDALISVKADRALDIGGGASCAAVDFEVKDY